MRWNKTSSARRFRITVQQKNKRRVHLVKPHFLFVLIRVVNSPHSIVGVESDDKLAIYADYRQSLSVLRPANTTRYASAAERSFGIG